MGTLQYLDDVAIPPARILNDGNDPVGIHCAHRLSLRDKDITLTGRLQYHKAIALPVCLKVARDNGSLLLLVIQPAGSETDITIPDHLPEHLLERVGLLLVGTELLGHDPEGDRLFPGFDICVEVFSANHLPLSSLPLLFFLLK
ncbi:hypothetical protein MBAV_000250 [Candidatus Magnetobacterium bavaricum]|uniref:Uncharacterized protein n=1 Tax=Candidatus Magnetobacterium bavaricum TaxID=29290 RepID=A0A0F3H093_9BACT|nr:hypothetical protein MBAV_000250 [Candidatus Magnetobacterium bavaricum]